MRVAVLCSTGGSVYRVSCERSAWLRGRIALVAADRPCGALQAAQQLGHCAHMLPWRGKQAFSDELLRLLQAEKIDLCLSFFTRLLGGRLLHEFHGRLLNFHPSLLPACPGLHGFEDTLASGARFVGSTVHFVDERMDTGWPLLQACDPRDPSLPVERLRHLVFLQQCKSLLQVVRWFEEGRVVLGPDGARVEGARYATTGFSPNLDFDDALALAA